MPRKQSVTRTWLFVAVPCWVWCWKRKCATSNAFLTWKNFEAWSRGLGNEWLQTTLDRGKGSIVNPKRVSWILNHQQSKVHLRWPWGAWAWHGGISFKISKDEIQRISKTPWFFRSHDVQRAEWYNSKSDIRRLLHHETIWFTKGQDLSQLCFSSTFPICSQISLDSKIFPSWF